MDLDNERVLIVRDAESTKLWIAKQPNVFKGLPDMQWDRALLDSECEALLYNPWRMFGNPGLDRSVGYVGRIDKARETE